jgi:hypothetical protein
LVFVSTHYPTKLDQFGTFGILFEIKYFSYVNIKSPYLLPAVERMEDNATPKRMLKGRRMYIPNEGREDPG